MKHSRSNHYLNRVEDVGTRQDRLHAHAAEDASRELVQRLESCIFKFGFRHGISTDEARHLLLNTGVRL